MSARFSNTWIAMKGDHVVKISETVVHGEGAELIAMILECYLLVRQRFAIETVRF